MIVAELETVIDLPKCLWTWWLQAPPLPTKPLPYRFFRAAIFSLLLKRSLPIAENIIRESLSRMVRNAARAPP